MYSTKSCYIKNDTLSTKVVMSKITHFNYYNSTKVVMSKITHFNYHNSTKVVMSKITQYTSCYVKNDTCSKKS